MPGLQHLSPGLTDAHPDVTVTNAALKKGLAQRFPADRQSYLAGKAAFIRETLAQLPRPDSA